MTLTNAMSETPIAELLRALNSEKEYLFFDISMFNVGASINIVCTNVYRQINQNTWNGYDFLIENSYDTKYYIAETLKSKLEDDTYFDNANQLKRVKKAIENYV